MSRHIYIYYRSSIIYTGNLVKISLINNDISTRIQYKCCPLRSDSQPINKALYYFSFIYKQ